MNPFEMLGFPVRLALEESELREAFRKAGGGSHPDSEGSADSEFIAIRDAMALLMSPARRLRTWAAIHGVDLPLRGTLSDELGDQFSRVASVTQRAEAQLRKVSGTHSALARALLERESLAVREALETTISSVRTAMEVRTEKFPALDAAGPVDPEAIAILARDLAFIERWLVTLRGLYARAVGY